MTPQRFVALQCLIFALVVAWLLYLLGPILTPFIAAAILAYICDPWVSKLSAWKIFSTRIMPRPLATVLVMLALSSIAILLAFIMLPLLSKEINHFVTQLPHIISATQVKLLPLAQQFFGETMQWDADMLKNLLKDLLKEHWQVAGGVAAKILPWLSGSGAILIEVLLNLILIPVVLFYLLCEWPNLLARTNSVIPRRWHSKVTKIAGEIDSVLAEFLRGQITVMLLMSVIYVIGLWAVGLEFALPIGLIAGMLVFVPYVGMIAGLSLATLVAATQFGQLTGVLAVWAVFGVGQLLEGFIITPRFVGERIGLHPLAVIFSLLAFGQLFGFFGVLLALPLSAALLVGFKHARKSYLASSLYLK